MPACRFHVIRVGVEPDLRGEPMRRVVLRALPSDAFRSDAESAPPPDGEISLLVTPAYAKKFAIGDEFDLAFHEAAS